MTIFLAFSAIGLSTDNTGEFASSLFYVILISLSLSWITAVSTTPLLCAMFMKPKEGGGYDIRAGREEYRQAHIPGSAFVDLKTDFSAPDPRLLFMLPQAQRFAAAAGAAGIGEGAKAVLHNRGPSRWGASLNAARTGRQRSKPSASPPTQIAS